MFRRPTGKNVRPLRIVLLIVCACAVLPVRIAAGQAAPDSTAAPSWEIDLAGQVSASQVGYQNWAEGGLNTLATTTALHGTLARASANWQQKHVLRLGFGVVKQDTLALRKAEDIVRLRSSFQYRGEGFFKHFSPTFAFDVNTQFVSGFNYKKNPFGGDGVPPVKVSDVFSPAVFAQSFGFTYDPISWFTQRVGIGTKETVVLIERLRQLYGLRHDQAVRMEMGLESRTEFDGALFENVRYKSSLGLFAAFNRANVPDLRWENVVAMKVNRWLGVNFEWVALYDRDIDRRVQVKESLSVGLSVALI